jgi:hypothetical protein
LAFKVVNRARMSANGAAGTGDFSLQAATAGFQSFVLAGITTGDTFPYVIEDGTTWEYGVGTFLSSDSFTRTTVRGSSIGGTTKVSFTDNAVAYVGIHTQDVYSVPNPPSLNVLTDVNVTEGAGIDGKVLTWKNTPAKWEPETPITTLAGLADVSVEEGAPIDGYNLTWTNSDSAWQATAPQIPASIPSGYLVARSSSDEDIVGINPTTLGGSITLGSLTDVAVTEGSGIDGYTLNWNNGAAKWEAVAPVASAAGVTTKNNGTTVGTSQTVLNFVNATTVTTSGDATTITVPTGGGGGSAVDILSPDRATGTTKSVKIEYQDFPGNSTATLIDYTSANPGYLQQIFVANSGGNADVLDDAVIKVYIDGSGTAAISMDAMTFFNSVYYPDNSFPGPPSSLVNHFFGANGAGATGSVGFFSKLPIPYTTEVKVTLTSGSSNDSTLWGSFVVQDNVANSWPNTQALRVSYSFIDAPSANSINLLAEEINASGGRLVGMYLMDDDVPHSMDPSFAALEGNIRIYLDAITKVYAASTAYALNNIIYDSNGNFQKVTTAGTSGSSPPTWSKTGGASTTDSGVTWEMIPAAPNQVWLSNAPFALDMTIVDPNGYVQRVTTAGTSTNGSIPSFNSTPGDTTTDNGVTWTNEGNTFMSCSYQTSGTEDYFLMGFYGNGVGFNFSSPEHGTGYGNTGGAGTRSFYRYHISDPIRFAGSILIDWQAGDTSQKQWSSGAPQMKFAVYYYVG